MLEYYTIESNNGDSKNKDITWFHRITALKLSKECNEALFNIEIASQNMDNT